MERIDYSHWLKMDKAGLVEAVKAQSLPDGSTCYAHLDGATPYSGILQKVTIDKTKTPYEGIKPNGWTIVIFPDENVVIEKSHS